MSTTPLSVLRTPLVRQELAQRVLTFLAADGMPIGDWAPTSAGGLENGFIDMATGTIVDLAAAKLAEAIKAGFLGYASGDWMTFLAKRFYKLDRLPATYTIQVITLTCADTAGPYNFAAGDLWVVGASGNRYQSLDAGSLQPGKTLTLRFQAENTGASYNDAGATITTLVTSLPGVTVSNAKVMAPSPASLAAGGTSTGTVTGLPPVGGFVSTADRFQVRITRSGQSQGIPPALFVVSIDDGRTWSVARAAIAFVPIDALCSLAFRNSALTNPSFIEGDIFYFANTSLLQQGSDQETDAQLSSRCRLRWLTLSDVPSPGTFDLWVRLASPEVNRVKVVSDPNAGNTALIYLASSAGGIGPDTLIVAQAYVSERVDPGEKVNVRPADVRSISVTGSVKATRSLLLTIQAQAEANWTAYLASVPIGGTVILAELEQAIMDAGAQDVASLAITGGSPNVILGDHEVPAPRIGSTLITSLRWDAV